MQAAFTSARQIAAISTLAMAGVLPATTAERACSAELSRAVASRSGKVQSLAAESHPTVLVTGGGIARLTDPDGEQFTNQFSFSASVYPDGTARGHANFVFSRLFSLKWGAVPGVSEILHLQSDITSGSVGPNGTVTLVGPFVETDYAPGEGVVYKEDSRQSGSAPLEVVVSEGSKTFLLTWCAFIPPAGTGRFTLEVITGSLKIHMLSN